MTQTLYERIEGLKRESIQKALDELPEIPNNCGEVNYNALLRDKWTDEHNHTIRVLLKSALESKAVPEVEK